MTAEFLLALFAVVLIAGSQLLFKQAARRNHSTRRTLLQGAVIAGLAINGIAAACWVYALRRLEINLVFPLLSLNYLLVPLGAKWCFGETLSRRRLGAILVIVAGVVLCLAAN